MAKETTEKRNCEKCARSAATKLLALALLALSSFSKLYAGVVEVDFFKTYQDAVVRFAREAEETGSACYLDAAMLVYPKNSLTSSVLDSKAKWRESAKETGAYFASDYASADMPVTFKHLKASRDETLGSTLIACYEANRHVVRVSELAGISTFLHETGHSLQRKALLERRFAKQSFVSASYRDRELGSQEVAGSRHLRQLEQRLKYLSSQDEFEVRLQDLNRFYAVSRDGSPILEPMDCVEALARIGLELSFEELESAFASFGWPFSEEQFKTRVLEVEKANREQGAQFEDARELCLMSEMINELDERLWPLFLRKILLEAPGHF